MRGCEREKTKRVSVRVLCFCFLLPFLLASTLFLIVCVLRSPLLVADTAIYAVINLPIEMLCVCAFVLACVLFLFLPQCAGVKRKKNF